MRSSVFFLALPITTISCLEIRQDATLSTTTIAPSQDSCKDHVSRELAIPTPPPGATSIKACSFEYTDSSSAAAMGDYYTQVDSFFNNLDSKVSSLMTATSCGEPVTTSYSRLCTGNVTVAHISRSTDGGASIGVTNAVIYQPLELPTRNVVLDWATVSTTTSEAAATQTDVQDSGASGFETGVGMAIGVVAIGCAWLGL